MIEIENVRLERTYLPVSLESQNLRDKLLVKWITEGGTSGWVLGFALDGVIWGKVNNGYLDIAYDYIKDAVPLRIETLQEIHLFNPELQMTLTKSDQQEWKLLILKEKKELHSQKFAIEEKQWLLGSANQKFACGYTRFVDPALSWHYVPLAEQGMQKALLQVRTYFEINQKKDGWQMVGRRMMDLIPS